MSDNWYERRCPYTGEVIDKGPESGPNPLVDLKIADRKQRAVESQRGRLLRTQQECTTTQPADDDLPSSLGEAEATK